MRKTFALYVILAAMLCGSALASRTPRSGDYRGFVDQPAGLFQTVAGSSPVLVIERRHEFSTPGSSGTAQSTYRYQYLLFSQDRPEQRRGEKAMHSGFGLLATSALLEEPLNSVQLGRLIAGEPRSAAPKASDALQDVIDELEGYKTTLTRIAARSTGDMKTCLEMAVAELEKAINGLKMLQAGQHPPGIEGEIEGHLDAAIAAIAKTHPEENTPLDRIMKSLRNLRANLF